MKDQTSIEKEASVTAIDVGVLVTYSMIMTGKGLRSFEGIGAVNDVA